MEYEFFRSQPADEDEQRRRQHVSLLESLLTDEESPAADNPDFQRPSLVNDLQRLLHSPELGLDLRLIKWVLVNGSPALVNRLILISRQRKGRHPILGALSKSDAALLLPSEHLCPDLQIATLNQPVKTVLLCFSGNALKFNIPVQLFHLVAVGHFDQVVYLRDRQRQRFTKGIPGLANSMAELNEYLARRIPAGSFMSTLGVSSGCTAALHFAERHNAGRAALFSPQFKFKWLKGSGSKYSLQAEQLRMYFAEHSQIDQGLHKQWSKTRYAASCRKIDSSSHGTLNKMFESGDLTNVFRWLRGEIDEPMPTHAPDEDGLAAGAATQP